MLSELPLKCPLGEQVAVEDEQDQDLADQAEGEHGRGDPDVEVGEDRDDRHHAERQPRPADVDPERVQFEAEEVGEAARQRRLEYRVGDHGAVAGADAELAPEPVADVGVEPPGCGLLPRHCHVPDGEHDEHDRGEQERGRRADALPVTDHDRDVEQHRRDRGRSGQGQEQHAAEADGVPAQLGYILALRDVVVFSRARRCRYAGDFGDLGLGHGYTSGAFAGSVTGRPIHDQEFRLS